MNFERAADGADKRAAIISACQQMNARGLNQGTSGNISVRHGDGLLITPTAQPYDTMTPDDIVWLDFDGRPDGNRAPSSEWRFHRDILKARPDMQAVVHAHPHACTTLAIMGRGIPPLHYMIAAAGGPTIRCAPYATFGTEELSRHALEALNDRFACLLAHHGMIAIGPSLAQAMWLAEEVETLARQYLACLPFGEPPLLGEDEIAKVRARMDNYGLLE